MGKLLKSAFFIADAIAVYRVSHYAIVRYGRLHNIAAGNCAARYKTDVALSNQFPFVHMLASYAWRVSPQECLGISID